MSTQTYDFSLLTCQHNRQWLGSLPHSLTLRIIATSLFVFVCYFTIGLQLAVVPGREDRAKNWRLRTRTVAAVVPLDFARTVEGAATFNHWRYLCETIGS